ncbi:MAG TPA: hypothetical protein VFU15_06475 [Bacteroidia bacterium]|nr:hypothetical protein [Bacteroidia bacterium]
MRFLLLLLLLSGTAAVHNSPDLGDIRKKLFFNAPFDSTVTPRQLAAFFDSKPDSFYTTKIVADSSDTTEIRYYYEYRTKFTDPVFHCPMRIEFAGSRRRGEKVRLEKLRVAPAEWVRSSWEANRLYRKVNRIACMPSMHSHRGFHGQEYWKTKEILLGNVLFVNGKEESNGNIWGLFLR